MNECESCVYYVYDEDCGQYVCIADIDEDDMGRLLSGISRGCRWYRLDDDYSVVRKQL